MSSFTGNLDAAKGIRALIVNCRRALFIRQSHENVLGTATREIPALITDFCIRMIRTPRLPMFRIILVLLALNGPAVAQAGHSSGQPSAESVIWRDPGDIRSLNLFWGPGGEKHQPQPPVSFLEEDMHGTSPKFDVRDSNDKKWKAKLGVEAKPETVASRLLWAVGYGANENYFFPQLQVTNMPANLQRGQNLAGHGGLIPNVRLQRHPEGKKRIGDWNWRHNPFYGTREFNGLRVMMGLIANWDLKDDNNGIFEDEKQGGPKLYEVSDVGTSFGTPGKKYSDNRSKGNLEAFARTKLIAHIHKNYIDLNFPKRPPLSSLFEFEWDFFFRQTNMLWIGRQIPRSDAKWLASLLAQLSPDQIRDAFRAAGYSPQQIELGTRGVISRIQELNSL
jgi:hypothetical protein